MVHIRVRHQNSVDVIDMLHDSSSELREFGNIQSAVQQQGELIYF